MMYQKSLMDDLPLSFIKRCFKERKILWTYHVNMRLKGRCITREAMLSAVETFEIIEEYPEDKYLPSYLVYASHGVDIFHIHVAIDRGEDNVRIVTAYKPTREKWNEDFTARRKP
jgi:hypothetical protein